MKLSNRTKKLILLSLVVVTAFTLSGCSVPTDANHQIIQIYPETTFSEIMSSENWFSAIFVWPLSQLINWATPKLGVAGGIAVVTILVNAVLAAVTLKSTIATQQMQLLQPELNKITKKYEGKTDDASRMKQANEMQALYKKYNVNPGGMLLTTFIQFPVIIAMYQAVQRASAVKSASFLGLSLETTPWNGMKEGQWMYLAIFIFMGVCQVLSMQLPQILAKKKAEKEAALHHRKPEDTANKQSKMMMMYMTAMILIFGLMWPAAMTIYWSIYSLVNIAKTLIVQKIIDNKKQKGEIAA